MKFSSVMAHSEKTLDLLSERIEEKIGVNFSWTRPANVPYPKIWKRIEVKSKNGQTYKVKIEDATPDRYEEIFDFMISIYDNHEPICR